MKKIVALIALLIGLAQFSWAQKFDPEEIRIGIQISPNFSWLTSEDNTINENGNNFGLKLGVIGEFYFHERYALISGIGFAFNHGGTLLHDNGGELWNRSQTNIPEVQPLNDFQYHIQYVEIPFGLKLRTGTKTAGSHSGFYFEVPVFTLGINTQARGTIIDTEVDKVDVKKEVNFLALSWGGGVGWEYNVSANTVVVAGLAYQQYFTDITDNYAADRSKVKMHNITFRAGVYF
ncbi:MAG: PorT family protein [Bacteroidetes bacterium]|jgi:opacity protein-like surface antigen|nr:PorT family protein [Bacteroidota bacterium]MDF1864033.1 porin family protein [Saprospiraceae bacterium]